VAGFTPPAYLVDGVLQRGYLYSLTAHWGRQNGSCYVLDSPRLPMHRKEVKAGTVLLLAGENPDDVRARFLVLADAYGFKAEDLKMQFVAGVIDIAAKMPEIKAEAEAINDLVLVVVDTGAAYFPGDESNPTLSRVTFLPGKPAVLVNCHPINNAPPPRQPAADGWQRLPERSGRQPDALGDRRAADDPALAGQVPGGGGLSQ